ncbi:MAG: hypothetical protein FJ265_08715 [Planctomycetes bacterium]|nr:hypothetical protein [Planctomycetota bacterium]
MAAFHDPASIQKVLAALGLPFGVTVLSPARAPLRQAELEFPEQGGRTEGVEVGWPKFGQGPGWAEGDKPGGRA